MKKTNLKKLLAILLLSLTVILIFSACSTNSQKDNAETDKSAGSLILSVNPEIRIDYDETGKVLSVKAINKDAETLITDENEFNGLSCNETVKSLVSKIFDAGYFVEEVEGRTQNVIIKLEKGSKYPTSEFLETLEQGIQTELDRLGLNSSPVTVDKNDYDKNGRITLEKAKEIALTQVALTNEEAIFTEAELDKEDNSYEIELFAKGFKYEFEINAENGKIIKASFEVENDLPSTKDNTKNDPADPEPDVPETEAPSPVTPESEPVTPEPEPITPKPEPVIPEPVVPDTPDSVIGEERAKEIALEYAGLNSADFMKCKLSDGGREYEIEFSSEGIEYDINIDAYTGKITDFEKDIDDDYRYTEPLSESVDPNPEVIPPSRITAEEAKTIALARAGVTQPDYIICKEDDDDYEIEFICDGIEYEVEVNAFSANITDYDEEADTTR